MSPNEKKEGARRPRIAVSMGDPNGIGPEVLLKCLVDPGLAGKVELVPVGSVRVLHHYAQLLGLNRKLGHVVEIEEPSGYILIPGNKDARAGKLSMMCVENATDLSLDGSVDAMVTCPISKEAIAMAGYDFPGHTEFIAERSEANSVLMMMVAGDLRVGLVSAHVPLARVASEVTSEAVKRTISVMTHSLRHDFSIESPRIAVLGLNPHAGDGGVLGDEELNIIIPAMRSLPAKAELSGPFPADAFFGRSSWTSYDGVVAMYHDQGLIPFKALSFGKGVNMTAGLPIVRTSPDHGTAFDIAGRGIAEENSLRTAILLAARISETRRQLKE